jgi:hypothetical protein
MNTTSLIANFARIGARAKVTDTFTRRSRILSGTVSLDVASDRDGEFFEIVASPAADPEVIVLDAQRADRHLLLLVRLNGNKRKFLCGHDERHWFVAAVPESAPVGTVQQAKEALKPTEVQLAEARVGLRGAARNRRKNSAYRRQGEWFFLPTPKLVVDAKLVLHNEPLRRGRSKPHWAAFCYRTGGETVYVCSRYPNGVTAEHHQRLLAKTPRARTWLWSTMRRNPGVYVRGSIRHVDHQTIVLHDWHQVLMNTENQAAAMRNVAFLD